MQKRDTITTISLICFDVFVPLDVFISRDVSVTVPKGRIAD